MTERVEDLVGRIRELDAKTEKTQQQRKELSHLRKLLSLISINADTLDGLHLAEIIEKMLKLVPRGGGGGGMSLHANEYHNPDMALATHSHTATVKTTLSFAVVGTLTVAADQAPTIVAPCALTIVKVKVVVKTAPTGASIIVDVNKAGTTIFTTQNKRPEIAIGATQDDSDTPDVTALAEGDKVTIDIDQIGSGTAGADLTVEVVCTQSVAFS